MLKAFAGRQSGVHLKELSRHYINDPKNVAQRLQRKRDAIELPLGENVYNMWMCYGLVDFRSFEQHTVASLYPLSSHILGG